MTATHHNIGPGNLSSQRQMANTEQHTASTTQNTPGAAESNPSCIAANITIAMTGAPRPVPQAPHVHQDALAAISDMLMEEQFLAMDRIISFDDMMFTAQTVDGSFLPWTSTDLGQRQMDEL